MDDTDFKNSLGSHRIPQEEAAEFLGKLKTAGPARELASKGLDAVAKHKMPLIGAAIGAAVSTAVQYMDNKPKKDGGPSTQRETAEKGLAASEKHMATLSEGGKQPSFTDKMTHEKSKFRAGASQVMEQHPVRGAAFAAPMGAAIGYGAGRLGEALLKTSGAAGSALTNGMVAVGKTIAKHPGKVMAGTAALAAAPGVAAGVSAGREAARQANAGMPKKANGDMLQYFKVHPEKLKTAASPYMHAAAAGAYLKSKEKKESEKKANGDMLQYFKVHPEKLKEKQERDAKKEKKAGVEMAEELARELAQKEKIAISFNQANEASKFVGRVSRLWEKHGPAVKNIASKAGKKAYDGVSSVGKRMGDIKDPIVKGMATGGVIGGVGGAAQGFLDPKENPYTGEKHRLRTALRKGMAGAAGGAVGGAFIGSMNKSSAAIPGLGGIGSMAKNFVSSMAPTAHKAVNAATPTVRAGIARLGSSTMGQAAGAGAMGGAALGAAKGLVAPGTGANGQPKSRLGAMAGGAVKGGLVGGALGAGAKAALPKVQQYAAQKLGK